MPLRAGNLGRVSEDKSGTVRSVTEQHDVNAAIISDNGWLEVSRYEDEGSASRFAAKARQDWQRLQADLEGSRLDVVVMWDTSRGSREPEDWFAFLRRCRDHEVLIYVSTEERTYKVRIARDWKTLADAGVDNAYESEKKSRDIKRALAANKRNGLPQGRVRWGFRYTYESVGEGKKPLLTGQEPVPERAAVCAEIIERIARGEPISVICQDLIDRKAPAPDSGWDRRQIRRLATSVTYIGKIRLDSGELIDGRWPPISSDQGFEDTFWAAQQVLDGPGRKGTKPGKAKYLLSYRMKCGGCGAWTYGEKPRNSSPSFRYTCNGLFNQCTSILMDEADGFVTAAVKRRLRQPDFYRNLTSGSDKEIIQARAEAARLRHELDEWAGSDISARAYAIREEKLLPLIEAAERRAEELAIPLALRELAEPGADIDARWDAMHIAAKRDAVRLLLPDLTLMPGKGPASERIVNAAAKVPVA